jgi:hypothetical protein
MEKVREGLPKTLLLRWKEIFGNKNQLPVSPISKLNISTSPLDFPHLKPNPTILRQFHFS